MKGEMREIASTGDTKVIWDTENSDEVEAAEKQFDLLKKKGFKAYAVKKNGEPGKEIKKFDEEAGMIIMVPTIVGG